MNKSEKEERRKCQIIVKDIIIIRNGGEGEIVERWIMEIINCIEIVVMFRYCLD